MCGLRMMVLLGAGFALGPACATTGEEDDAGRPDVDARDVDGRADADVGAEVEAEVEARACTSSAECADDFECTQDYCSAAGTCRHEPLDELCADGERCTETAGCVSGRCTRHEDCWDTIYCDGEEQCIGGGCYEGDPRDCDDGNPCTNDYCDTSGDTCVREPIDGEGCAGDGGGDGAVPFDPERHYSGRFWLSPPQSSACGAATYSIDTVTFTRSVDSLSVSGPPCAMTQAPPPSDENFSVSCVQGACGTYTLSGTFLDSNNFLGHWSASFGSSCSICSPQEADVVGARR
jgi:hypothetical protein